MEDAAKKIVLTLRDAGFIAYYAGGYVRDFLMKNPSCDVDIATNATPDQVIDLFDKTVAVGKQFGVVVVLLDNTPFEVSSFRKDDLYIDGRRPTSVTFSTPEEDAMRRDFTINGLFYDPVEDTVYDFVGGQKDLQKGVIRAIGDPMMRIQEDRLRMIRAVRFSCRFQFPLEEKTEEAIRQYATSLYPAVAVERVWQEFEKMAKHHHFVDCLLQQKRLGFSM